MEDKNKLEIILNSGRKIEALEFQAYHGASSNKSGEIIYLNHRRRILDSLRNSDNSIIIANESCLEIIPKNSIESIKFYYPTQ